MPQYVGQGGSITLRVQYQTGAGALIDPVTPLVTVIKPDLTTQVGPVAPTRDSLGTYSYVFAVPVAAPLGDWIGRFTGTINGSLVTGDDPFTVVTAGSITPVVASPILTLAEYRAAMGIDPTDTRDDSKYEALLPYVSAVIRARTGRDFGSVPVTEIRTFEYDGSGYLDIDDATEITQVTMLYQNGDPVTLSATDWAAKPERRDDAPVFEHILLPAYAGQGSGSPEMGFTRNLDVYARERSYPYIPNRAQVTGTWGWESVPGDIKMAAVWTLQEWVSRPSGEALSAEAIEGWSRAWGGRGGQMAAALAIPARALDILSNYSKVMV